MITIQAAARTVEVRIPTTAEDIRPVEFVEVRLHRWEKHTLESLMKHAARGDEAARTVWTPVLAAAKKLIKERARGLRAEVRRMLGVRSPRSEQLLMLLASPEAEADGAVGEKAWRQVREWTGLTDYARARHAAQVLRACMTVLEG